MLRAALRTPKNRPRLRITPGREPPARGMAVALLHVDRRRSV
ncbi:MAG: hypothetical protein AVDCRST_MAG53-1587 [uncultured Solirubrobacteraceae bacterium]|uniref:Uncharacterized protein n=1 Tax=uncultured Solirubrobacteraceae bacterium TaxID=1162706 RepID=A0A6J4SCK2_9ACTN|nr:MAG: hypothetical protein AVDCRST_MAG53-1587 [uncultured Solirubrobacteraceae bacterium]